jgi:hypothetical protein
MLKEYCVILKSFAGCHHWFMVVRENKRKKGTSPQFGSEGI